MDRYPICKKCGHEASTHSTTTCKKGAGNILVNVPICDCNGWERDENWPPRVPITEVRAK